MKSPPPRDRLVKVALEHVGELSWLLPLMHCPCVPGSRETQELADASLGTASAMLTFMFYRV